MLRKKYHTLRGSFSHWYFFLVFAYSVYESWCPFVCHTPEMTLPDGLKTSGRRAYHWYWVLGRIIFFQSSKMFFSVEKNGVFGFLQSTPLCIVGELAGGGSAAVAVGIKDRWHVLGDRWQVPGDRWQVTGNRWHVTGDRWQVNFFVW